MGLFEYGRLEDGGLGGGVPLAHYVSYERLHVKLHWPLLTWAWGPGTFPTNTFLTPYLIDIG